MVSIIPHPEQIPLSALRNDAAEAWYHKANEMRARLNAVAKQRLSFAKLSAVVDTLAKGTYYHLRFAWVNGEKSMR